MTQRPIIPGDALLTERISQAATGGSLSHAVILSGQGDLLSAARFAAAAMQCTAPSLRPCGECAACSKTLREIHPDVTVVVDDEHKNISTDILRSVRADAYVMPNEGKRKIYIFPDSSLLEVKSQNVLLKVLEEGPDHAAFIFCAENSAVLLPTIRSRAVEYKLSPAAKKAEVSPDAQQLAELICRKKKAQTVSFFTDLENRKVSREELQQLLSDTRDLLADVLAALYCADHCSTLARTLAGDADRRTVAAAIEILQQYIRNCGYNTGIGHLCGALGAELTG